MVTAADLVESVLLFVGGKSFSVSMSPQAQTVELLPDVRGLVCFGFPLHPAGEPSIDRARHLDNVRIPVLLLQGTRDKLAEVALSRGVATGLGASTTLLVTLEADHSFYVPAKSGITDAQVMEGLPDAAASWTRYIQRTHRRFGPPLISSVTGPQLPTKTLARLVERVTFTTPRPASA